MPWTREEKYFASQLIWRQNIQNCLKIDATLWYDSDYYWDKKLKNIAGPGSLYKKITKKKHSFDVSCWKGSKWSPLHLFQ